MKKKINELMALRLLNHYKHIYLQYMHRDIRDDFFELGQVLECEHILIKFYGVSIKTIYEWQDKARKEYEHGKSEELKRIKRDM